MRRRLRNLFVNRVNSLNDPNNQRIAVVASFITILLCLPFLFFGRILRQRKIVSIEGTSTPAISITSAIPPTRWWIKATPTFPLSQSNATVPFHSTETNESNCLPDVSFSLRPGIFAYISLNPPLPNRIRSGPGKAYLYLGQIEPGDGIRILDGPQCADGFSWWLVESTKDELRGWTAQEGEKEQWIIPCPDQIVTCTQKSPPTLATSNDRDTINNNQCKSEKLSLGILAHVKQDSLLVIRSEPNTGYVIGRAGPMSEINIIGGPICLDGAVWWRVKIATSNLSGWTMENGLYICSQEDECN